MYILTNARRDTSLLNNHETISFQAISTPTEEFQQKAWQAVMPLVSRLKRFYEFSTELGKISLELLCGKWHLDLCKDSLEPVYNPRLFKRILLYSI
jgi:Protein of unknown function (DUF1394).